jgi:hypothetical protein
MPKKVEKGVLKADKTMFGHCFKLVANTYFW